MADRDACRSTRIVVRLNFIPVASMTCVTPGETPCTTRTTNEAESHDCDGCQCERDEEEGDLPSVCETVGMEVIHLGSRSFAYLSCARAGMRSCDSDPGRLSWLLFLGVHFMPKHHLPYQNFTCAGPRAVPLHMKDKEARR